MGGVATHLNQMSDCVVNEYIFGMNLKACLKGCTLAEEFWSERDWRSGKKNYRACGSHLAGTPLYIVNFLSDKLETTVERELVGETDADGYKKYETTTHTFDSVRQCAAFVGCHLLQDVGV